MSDHPTPPAWLGFASWIPVLVYFAVKYLIIGSENVTRNQTYLLIGFVILAEVALWQYRKSFRPKQTDNHGTD
ncbi:hypothetical protein FUA23_19985 [Neolewinella aurantiaca]|uniref:Uncharacterized protein n=1 Tax=Neolewinella aurantiaca TaxID=2602767 RepID=A0A5C7F9F5_9BACT|nr:hypothetical protein [Neolewinella aurantiaca]TXF86018.1 hypothetical protein FUA23_19985 [Neolewinella aurantiaca]